MTDLFGKPKPSDISAEQKLEAVRRELKYRRWVYPRRVNKNKMTQAKADEQILLFEAIEQDYIRLSTDSKIVYMGEDE